MPSQDSFLPGPCNPILEEREERLKAEALAKVERNPDSLVFLRLMRAHARLIARERGTVTSDDLRLYADREGIVAPHRNCWGAVFQGKEWTSNERVRSRYPGHHARNICVWRLK